MPVLNARERTHGNYKWQSKRYAALCAALVGPRKLSAPHQEALDMICIKLARIIEGDPNCEEHWHDIAGYARLAEVNCIPSVEVSEPSPPSLDDAQSKSEDYRDPDPNFFLPARHSFYPWPEGSPWRKGL